MRVFILRGGIFVRIAAVSAMSTVHENVHQWAKQQYRVGPPLRQMGSMFRPQKIAGHRPDHQEADGIA